MATGFSMSRSRARSLIATQRAGSRPGNGTRAKPVPRWTSKASAASQQTPLELARLLAHVFTSTHRRALFESFGGIGSARARDEPSSPSTALAERGGAS